MEAPADTDYMVLKAAVCQETGPCLFCLMGSTSPEGATRHMAKPSVKVPLHTASQGASMGAVTGERHLLQLVQ